MASKIAVSPPLSNAEQAWASKDFAGPVNTIRATRLPGEQIKSEGTNSSQNLRLPPVSLLVPRVFDLLSRFSTSDLLMSFVVKALPRLPILADEIP
jgi:hypothetical protein